MSDEVKPLTAEWIKQDLHEHLALLAERETLKELAEYRLNEWHRCTKRASKAEAERDAAVRRVQMLEAFCDKISSMTTGGTWQEMLDNDVELMKEANALLNPNPAAPEGEKL